MPEDSVAYDADIVARLGRSVAKLERAQLASLFSTLGPDAPTLAGSWDTHHLVAHLVYRESNPVTLAKSPIPKLGSSAVDEMVAKRDYDDLVATWRDGPGRLSPFSVPGMDRTFNLTEHFVHHEDVRRAQPEWSPRVLPRWAEDQLWSSLAGWSRWQLRHSPVGVVLVRTDGEGRRQPVKKESTVEVTGLPSELMLWAFGRIEAARVAFSGDDPVAVDELRRKRFRL
jgi:uncharacterized protein (TIGR03085 family)